MVGRNVQLVVDRGESHPQRAAALSVHGPARRATIAATRPSRASRFDVRAGEILGIAGVAGNGQDELVEALTGLRKPASGRVELTGKNITGAGPRALQNAGMSFVPGDRHRFGLVLSFPLEDNLVLTQYDEPPFARGPFRQRRRDPRMGEAGDRSSTTSGRRRRRCTPARCRAATSRRRRRPRVQPRPDGARARPADARPRRRQHRVHPPPGDREARRQARRSCSCRRSSTRSWSCPTGSRSCTAARSSPSSTARRPNARRSAC